MTRAPQIVHGDCLEIMKMLPDNSVDSIVTDPPYGLGFMGKAWDALPPGREWAEECLRVLKPGGHLLAFGGTRTWHRLAVAVEDAGFEIRDSIAWMYGSGFPKSLDVSKAIDKQRVEDLEPAAEVARYLVRHMDATGLRRGDINRAVLGVEHAGGSAQQWTTTRTDRSVKPRVPQWEQWQTLKSFVGLGDEMDAEVWRLNGRKGTPGENWDAREVIDERPAFGIGGSGILGGHTEGATAKTVGASMNPAAQQWQGWGTALKPAFEPIVVARKPLIGTVAANVQAHGTGALNIDACRIATDGRPLRIKTGEFSSGSSFDTAHSKAMGEKSDMTGRWPANVALDEHMAAVLDGQSGIVKTGAVKPYTRAADSSPMFAVGQDLTFMQEASSGGASRFFYVAKAPKKERPVVDDVAHATVKPLALMRWLVRLVTPEGGTVLEPFAGSGTTVEACILEGFHCIAIEREAEYLPLIQARIDRQDAA